MAEIPKGGTLPETNIAPENGWFGDYFPIGFGLFSGAMLVLGRVGCFIRFFSGSGFIGGTMGTHNLHF